MPEIAAGLLAHLFSAGDEISSSRIARILLFSQPGPVPDLPGRLRSFTACPVSSCANSTTKSPTQVWDILSMTSISTIWRGSSIVILSAMPSTLLSGMGREDDNESQNSTFSTGVKGGGVGARSREIKGRKIESVGEIVLDAETGTSGIAVGVDVSVEVGMVVVIMLVGEEVTVVEIVSVISGVALGVGVVEGATGVVSTEGVRETFSVVAI